MLRVVGRVSMMAAALALIASASVFANDRVQPVSTSAIGGADGVGPRTFTGTGFEPSEGFVPGNMDFQNGWRNLGAGTRGGSGVTGQPFVSNGSAQTAILDQNFNFPHSTVIGYRTPRFKDFHQTEFNVDFFGDDFEGANYYIQPQAALEGYRTTTMMFGYDHLIYCIDDPGTGAVFTPIGDWTNGQWYTAEMRFDYAARTIQYLAGPDKDNLVLLHTGVMWTPATQVDEFVFYSDNWQDTGAGSVAPDPDPRGPAGYIDNFRIKPEPGTLAMLGIGALLALRRRSR